MTVTLAVVAVSVGSLAFRLAPLLGARAVPREAAEVAGWVGLAVLSGTTLRAALSHEDASLPAPSVVAVLVIAAALLLVHRGRSLPLSLGVGVLLYLALGGGCRVLS